MSLWRRQSITGVLALVVAASVPHAQRTAVPDEPDARTVAHVLDRLGFGARPGDVARVQQIGLAAYIDRQLQPHRMTDEIVAARMREFPTLSMSTSDLWDEYFQPAMEERRRAQATSRRQAQNPPPSGTDSMPPTAAAQAPAAAARRLQQEPLAELMQARLLRAALSERQLEEVLVDFWFNHFNVYSGKGQVRQYLIEYERDAIRPHVLGRFRDMLGATARSPAMLIYLDNFQSRTAENSALAELQLRLSTPGLSQRQRQQLLARLEQAQTQQRRARGGLNENYGRELLELHTLGVDGGYTQQDVVEVAKILTGWTIDRPQQGGRFVFRPAMHEPGAKTVLGRTFWAEGEREGERLFDMLASHPSTARHIAFKLAQRFVADEPPAALVDRVARTFLDTKGDLRAVTRAVVTSPEFFDGHSHSAKVKTPLEFVVSSVRATGATVTGAQPMVQALRDLGMPMYGAQPPTGYSMTADAWVSTGALLDRMNFAARLAGTGANRGNAAGRRGGAAARAPFAIDFATIAPDTSEATIDRLVDTILAGRASETTRQTLARAETPQQMLALALGSPEFQRR